MAASHAITAFERDLRSADREFKRDRDLAAKWMYGSRQLGTQVTSATHNEQSQGQCQEASAILLRPSKKYSEWSHTPKKKSHNVNKHGSNWDLPPGRVRSAGHAKEEIRDSTLTRSLIDLLPTYQAGRAFDDASIIYENNIQLSMANGPLPLGMFVKMTGRETEKLVEKEYEVLDDRGQLLKGRKARHSLRHGNNQKLQEDEGFELL